MAKARCSSAPARRPSASGESGLAQPATASPLAVKGRALRLSEDGDYGAAQLGAASAALAPAGARPKRRQPSPAQPRPAPTVLDFPAGPALAPIRTRVEDPAPGRQPAGGHPNRNAAKPKPVGQPASHINQPPSRAAAAVGGGRRPYSGGPPAPARLPPPPVPYHQRLRGLLDGAPPAPLSQEHSHQPQSRPPLPFPLMLRDQRKPNAPQPQQQQQLPAGQPPPCHQAGVAGLPQGPAVADMAPMVQGRSVDLYPPAARLEKPIVIPGPCAAYRLSGDGGVPYRGGGDIVTSAGVDLQLAVGPDGEVQGDEEYWEWLFQEKEEPESPYGSDVLRGMLAAISPRFSVRRPDDYIPVTPSDISSGRYVRSDVWGWSCPASPVPQDAVAAETAAAAAVPAAQGGSVSASGAAPASPLRLPAHQPQPRQSLQLQQYWQCVLNSPGGGGRSPEHPHKRLGRRAAAAIAAISGCPSPGRPRNSAYWSPALLRAAVAASRAASAGLMLAPAAEAAAVAASGPLPPGPAAAEKAAGEGPTGPVVGMDSLAVRRSAPAAVATLKSSCLTLADLAGAAEGAVAGAGPGAVAVHSAAVEALTESSLELTPLPFEPVLMESTGGRGAVQIFGSGDPEGPHRGPAAEQQQREQQDQDMLRPRRHHETGLVAGHCADVLSPPPKTAGAHGAPVHDSGSQGPQQLPPPPPPQLGQAGAVDVTAAGARVPAPLDDPSGAGGIAAKSRFHRQASERQHQQQQPLLHHTGEVLGGRVASASSGEMVIWAALPSAALQGFRPPPPPPSQQQQPPARTSSDASSRFAQYLAAPAGDQAVPSAPAPTGYSAAPPVAASGDPPQVPGPNLLLLPGRRHAPAACPWPRLADSPLRVPALEPPATFSSSAASSAAAASASSSSSSSCEPAAGGSPATPMRQRSRIPPRCHSAGPTPHSASPLRVGSGRSPGDSSSGTPPPQQLPASGGPRRSPPVIVPLTWEPPPLPRPKPHTFGRHTYSGDSPPISPNSTIGGDGAAAPEPSLAELSVFLMSSICSWSKSSDENSEAAAGAGKDYGPGNGKGKQAPPLQPCKAGARSAHSASAVAPPATPSDVSLRPLSAMSFSDAVAAAPPPATLAPASTAFVGVGASTSAAPMPGGARGWPGGGSCISAARTSSSGSSCVGGSSILDEVSLAARLGRDPALPAAPHGGVEQGVAARTSAEGQQLGGGSAGMGVRPARRRWTVTVDAETPAGAPVLPAVRNSPRPKGPQQGGSPRVRQPQLQQAQQQQQHPASPRVRQLQRQGSVSSPGGQKRAQASPKPWSVKKPQGPRQHQQHNHNHQQPLSPGAKLHHPASPKVRSPYAAGRHQPNSPFARQQPRSPAAMAGPGAGGPFSTHERPGSGNSRLNRTRSRGGGRRDGPWGDDGAALGGSGVITAAAAAVATAISKPLAVSSPRAAAQSSHQAAAAMGAGAYEAGSPFLTPRNLAVAAAPPPLPCLSAVRAADVRVPDSLTGRGAVVGSSVDSWSTASEPYRPPPPPPPPQPAVPPGPTHQMHGQAPQPASSGAVAPGGGAVEGVRRNLLSSFGCAGAVPGVGVGASGQSAGIRSASDRVAAAAGTAGETAATGAVVHATSRSESAAAGGRASTPRRRPSARGATSAEAVLFDLAQAQAAARQAAVLAAALTAARSPRGQPPTAGLAMGGEESAGASLQGAGAASLPPRPQSAQRRQWDLREGSEPSRKLQQAAEEGPREQGDTFPSDRDQDQDQGLRQERVMVREQSKDHHLQQGALRVAAADGGLAPASVAHAPKPPLAPRDAAAALLRRRSSSGAGSAAGGWAEPVQVTASNGNQQAAAAATAVPTTAADHFHAGSNAPHAQNHATPPSRPPSGSTPQPNASAAATAAGAEAGWRPGGVAQRRGSEGSIGVEVGLAAADRGPRRPLSAVSYRPAESTGASEEDSAQRSRAAGQPDLQAHHHWSYQRNRERAKVLSGVLMAAAAAGSVGAGASQGGQMPPPHGVAAAAVSAAAVARS